MTFKAHFKKCNRYFDTICTFSFLQSSTVTLSHYDCFTFNLQAPHFNQTRTCFGSRSFVSLSYFLQFFLKRIVDCPDSLAAAFILLILKCYYDVTRPWGHHDILSPSDFGIHIGTKPANLGQTIGFWSDHRTLQSYFYIYHYIITRYYIIYLYISTQKPNQGLYDVYRYIYNAPNIILLFLFTKVFTSKL